MPVDWKKVFGFVQTIPAVRTALGLTYQELQENPAFVKLVTKYQEMSPGQCAICLAHTYMIDKRLTPKTEAPRHECADHNFEWRG